MSQQGSDHSPDNASRRSFLRTSATAALGTALCREPVDRARAHAAGSDILKVGLIGCGGRGTGAAAQAMQRRSARAS